MVNQSQKTTYEVLIEAGFEFVQASKMDDGRFEVILIKENQQVTLFTDEPFADNIS